MFSSPLKELIFDFYLQWESKKNVEKGLLLCNDKSDGKKKKKKKKKKKYGSS